MWLYLNQKDVAAIWKTKIFSVWYVGEQLPLSFTKRKSRKSVNSSKCKLNFRSEYTNKSDVVDYDDDDYIPRKKRPKVCFIS